MAQQIDNASVCDCCRAANLYNQAAALYNAPCEHKRLEGSVNRRPWRFKGAAGSKLTEG